MRRLPALVLSLLLAVSGLVLVAGSASALTAPAGFKLAKGGRYASYLIVQWDWSSTPKSYDIQVAQNYTFTQGLKKWSVTRAATKPSGGVQKQPLRNLLDATTQYVRIRAVRGTTRSGWSTMKTYTAAKWPDEISSFAGTPGKTPGEVTFTWSGTGGNTDFFRLDVATSPFSSTDSSLPKVGKNQQSFKIDKSQRTFTLTPAQTQALGAGIGTGWHVMARLYAVRKGNATSQERAFKYLRSSRVPGQAPAAGTPLRVGTWNVRLAKLDSGTSHDWTKRMPLIVKYLKQYHPAIISMQELIPSMWKDPGQLKDVLAANGLGNYVATRDRVYADGNPGDSRIIYDSDKLTLLSNCPQDDLLVITCATKLKVTDGSDYVPWGLFEDQASGKRFWFSAFHLESGSTKAVELSRQAEIVTLASTLTTQNALDYPVILAGDTNSHQDYVPDNVSTPSLPMSLPHDALMAAGFYDTASTVDVTGDEYDTANHFESQSPDALGFGSRLDVIATKGMPGADHFTNVVVTDGKFPSDHNLVLADVQLP